MPVLQIAYDSVQSGLPQVLKTIVKFTPSSVLTILSLSEVWFRVWIRFNVIPFVFVFVVAQSGMSLLNITLQRFINYIESLGESLYNNQDPLKQSSRGFHTHKKRQHSSMFSPATNVPSIFTKTWILSDYVYDRFVLHAPECIYNLAMGYPIEKYYYRSRALFSIYYDDERFITEDKEKLEYETSLRTFKLNAPTPAQKANRSPLTPSDVLNEYQYSTPNSIASNYSPAKNISNVSQGSDEIHSLDTRKPMLNKSIVDVTPGKHSTVKIKFNRHRKGSFKKFKRSLHLDTDSQGNESLQSIEETDYEAVKNEIKDKMDVPGHDDGSLGPLFVRLAWHTSATYDKNTHTGGSNGGTMRFPPELTDTGNTGLHTALLVLEVVKQKYPAITYGDLWTLAGVTALEAMGSHPIAWKPGRIDCVDTSLVPPNGRLPLGYLGSEHIKEVFMKRLGFDERETVLLIGGGHSLGRCHVKYSGWEGKWTENPVHFSNRFFTALLNESWEQMVVPQTGNQQFHNDEHDLMMLPTDMELLKNTEFKKWVKFYAADNERFLHDFAVLFSKLIELGVPR